MVTIATVVASASTAVLGTGFLAGASPATNARSECPAEVAIVVDGTKGPGTGDSVDPDSPLVPAVARWERQNPVATVVNLHYPAGMVAGVWGWNVWYDQSVSDGETALRSLVREWDSRCEGTQRWTLIGYSQGAVVAGDFASEVDRSGSSLARRTAALLYSDPKQPVTGLETRTPGIKIGEGVTSVGGRPPFRTVRVTWLWMPGDTIADSPPVDPSAVNPQWVAAVVRGYTQWHTSYRWAQERQLQTMAEP